MQPDISYIQTYICYAPHSSTRSSCKVALVASCNNISWLSTTAVWVLCVLSCLLHVTRGPDVADILPGIPSGTAACICFALPCLRHIIHSYECNAYSNSSSLLRSTSEEFARRRQRVMTAVLNEALLPFCEVARDAWRFPARPTWLWALCVTA